MKRFTAIMSVLKVLNLILFLYLWLCRDLPFWRSFWTCFVIGIGEMVIVGSAFLACPFRQKWETFRLWRRNRNPELVELDAFRELVAIERRLKEYPNAVPLLEAAVKNYAITGQEGKKRDVISRLRKVNPESSCLKVDVVPRNATTLETEVLVEKSVELVQKGERVSVSLIQRKFCVCYKQAALVWNILEERGLVGRNKMKGVC